MTYDRGPAHSPGPGLPARVVDPDVRPETSSWRRVLSWLIITALLAMFTALAIQSLRDFDRTTDASLLALDLAATGDASPQHIEELRATGLVGLAVKSHLELGQPERALAVLAALPDAERGSYRTAEAAALLESGDWRESLLRWNPSHENLSAFERRLLDAQEEVAGGTVARLFDRRGTLIASHTTNGRTIINPNLAQGLVPSEALELMPSSGGARLTLDLDLSRKLLRTMGRNPGAIVVIDVETGALVAAVGREHRSSSMTHDLLSQQREPASIAKLITSTAALRSGVDVNRRIADMRCDGALTLSGQPLYCTSATKGRLRGGLDYAMATSCNVAFARLGHELTHSQIFEEYYRYGFGRGELGTAKQKGYIPSEWLSDREVGDLSIGLNHVEITPLHAAVFARTLTDGWLRSPHLLHATDGLLGSSARGARASTDALAGDPIVRAFDVGAASSERVIRDEWLSTLHSSMAAVAGPGGTASRFAPRGYPIAMKTGTGQTEGVGFHVNYIGFAPLENPRVAFALRLDRGRTSRKIRREASYVAGQVLRILRRSYPVDGGPPAERRRAPANLEIAAAAAAD